MQNKVLAAYVAVDAVFVVMGAIMLGFSIIVGNEISNPPTEGEEAARHLLYQRFPLTAGVVNSIFYFLTFLATIPAITTPARVWLKISGVMAAATSVFSLIIGLDLWILTLNTKNDFSPLWNAQTPQIQELMQTAVCDCPSCY